MIRMSSNQFTANYILQLQRAYERQAKLFEQADGGSLHRPSDNAIDYHKLLSYQYNLNENEQYQRDVKAGASWMSTSDGAIVHISEIMQTFEEKSVAAANDYNNESDWNAIGKEMLAIIQDAVTTANQQEGDRYVFSGMRDLIKPFELSTTKYERGLAKTLDNSQANFFRSGDSSYSIDTHASLTQFLTLKVQGDEQATDNLFYLDTTTGYIYDKKFMDEDYKNIYENGRGRGLMAEDSNGNLVDAIGKLGSSFFTSSGELNFKVSDYFNAQGIIYRDNMTFDVYTADDGTTMKFTSDDNGATYTYNGKVYTKDTTTTAGVTTYTQINSDDPVTFSFTEDTNNAGSFTYNNKTYTQETRSNQSLSIDWRSDATSNTLEFSTIQQYIVEYKGDPNHISMVKINGAIDPTSDTVNVTGQEMFGKDIFDDENSGNSMLDINGNPVSSGSAMLNEMLTVLAKTEQHDSKWMTSDGITIADVAHATLIVSETSLGARHQLYDNVSTMLEKQNENITGDITDISSTDVAQLAIKLMEMQTLYSMSLSMGARILPQSLADYL